MSLPIQLRYADLKSAKIIRNHVGLKRLIELYGFPAGKWLGPNTHVWDEAEVEAWLASRPVERPPCADAEPTVEINNAEIVTADDDPEPVPEKKRQPAMKPAKRSAKRTAKRRARR